jgi:hypothetical protein
MPEDMKPEWGTKDGDLAGEEMLYQRPHDYGVTGTRLWGDLSGKEQDEYVLACFQGEAKRAETEKRFDLYDRTGRSIAEALLGVFYQYDYYAGVSRFEPGEAIRAERVTLIRSAALDGTLLGDRLRLTLTRRHVSVPEYSKDPRLKFYSVAPATPGMEILDAKCTGDFIESPPADSYKSWNDFPALELMQVEYLELRKREGGELMRKTAMAKEPARSIPQPPAPIASPVNSQHEEFLQKFKLRTRKQMKWLVLLTEWVIPVVVSFVITFSHGILLGLGAAVLCRILAPILSKIAIALLTLSSVMQARKAGLSTEQMRMWMNVNPSAFEESDQAK